LKTFFWLVAKALLAMGNATGFTYNEINIIVFYGIIPLIYAIMIDKILRRWVVTPLYSLIIIGVVILTDFGAFCDWFFGVNANFLSAFGLMGIDYIVASVVICIIIPLIVGLALFRFSYWPVVKRLIKRSKEKRQHNHTTKPVPPSET